MSKKHWRPPHKLRYRNLTARLDGQGHGCNSWRYRIVENGRERIITLYEGTITKIKPNGVMRIRFRNRAFPSINVNPGKWYGTGTRPTLNKPVLFGDLHTSKSTGKRRASAVYPLANGLW